jgi:thiol-disulfide isomerase/thioredoxin
MRLLIIVLTWLIVDHASALGPPAEAPVKVASPPQVATYLRQAYGESSPPEATKMLLAILEGSKMGAGEGWFGPAQTRFDFEWLAKQCDLEESAEGIPREKFAGPAELFSVLDRNRDGMIQPQDLDWSEQNPYVGMMYTLNRVFRRLDAAGTGHLSREDWLDFFDEATRNGETLTAADFSGALLAGFTGSFAPGDGPDTATLIRGLFDGEIGSMCEGPQVGQRAPLFSLRKVQGDGVIELSSLLGEKPLVIVLGNFTCGPFRAFYPAVDALYQKYKEQANFLMVYVREAHPTDGWSMESNTRVGVAVAQPRTFDQRAEVAEQFCTRLNPSMPVVVDELSDPVGHAYSGMPARLYLIDTQGKVAYKGGRGPFGFRPPELEQALAMCLLESENVFVDFARPRE